MGYVSPFYKEVEKIKKSIDKGNAPLNFRDLSEKNQDMFWTALTETCGEGIMPFLISTRMQYSSLEDIIKNKDQIVFIANDEKTVWELFQMFLFHKIDQRNPFLNINFEEYIKIVYDDIDHLIQEVINQNLHIWQSEDIYYVLTNLTSEYDKKKLGSVHTPMKLVQEIFDHIPEEGLGGYILDPACGDGTFLFEAKKRLMKIYGDMGCKSHNFIYGVDIDPKKCYITSALLDPRGECESNIYLGNSLNKEFMGEIMKKFTADLVMLGNPPFQNKEGSENSTNSTDLSVKFTKMCLELKPDCLALVLPAEWAGVNNSKFKELMFKKAGMKEFVSKGRNAFPDIDKHTCYIICENGYKGETTITDEKGQKVSLNLRENVEFIPASDVKVKSILEKIFQERRGNMSHRWLRGKLYRNKINPVSKDDNNAVEFIEAVGGKRNGLKTVFINMNVESTGYGIHKVVIGNMGCLTGLGEIKLATPEQVGGHSVVFLTVNSEDEREENLKAYLETKFVNFIVSKVRTATPNSKSIFKYIPEVDLSKKWTDKELYKYFQLSEDEICHIEQNYEPIRKKR